MTSADAAAELLQERLGLFRLAGSARVHPSAPSYGQSWGYQVGPSRTEIAPDLSVRTLYMGPFHDQLQPVGLDILRSIIVSEWQLNENLAVVQAAIINV